MCNANSSSHTLSRLFYSRAGMKSNSITFESLVITRESAALSQPLSLSLKAGDLLVVHGSNGSGKSTLLKLLAGLLPVQQGTIVWGGEWPVNARPLYLSHKRGLTPSMSVMDNVSFWAKASGAPELTLAALRYFDLEDAADTKVGELSAGWQQRVALTRLITMPSLLWLLDEPTANLDANGMALLQSLLQSRCEQGGIVVIASHLPMQGPNITTLHLGHVIAQDEVAA
jgi:heme exporter protein A